MGNLSKYQKLNNSFEQDELIFHVGSDAGFYSEFNNMVLAIAYCLKYRIKFLLYSEDANFGYKEGWTDFFVPFCDEVTSKFHRKHNLRYVDPFFLSRGFNRIKVLLYRLSHRHTYLTSDLFYRFRTVDFQRMFFSIPELGIDGNLRDISRYIIEMIYQFNENTELEIKNLIKSIELPDKYIGLHIRGGDKFVEHELEACATYMTKAEQLSSLREAYVLTDDYTVIQTLRRDYPYWHFYTLTDPSEKGYFHQSFLKQTADDRRKKLIKLFASMELLRSSELFVGTLSSNPGMFLGMCMDRVYGIDIDEWTVW